MRPSENGHCQRRRTLERCDPPAIPVFPDTLDDGHVPPVQRHIVEHTSISWSVPSTISAFHRPPSTRSSRLRRSRFRDTTLKQHEKTENPNLELPRRLAATRLSDFAARHSHSDP